MRGVSRTAVARRPADAPRRPIQARAAGQVVGCVFCREPIAISSFVAAPPDPRVLSTACTNCGLMVSATSAALAAWSRPNDSSDGDLADRLRARRVALGTRAILDRVGASEALEGEIV